MLRRLFWILFLIPALAKSQQPNIVLILGDDLRYDSFITNGGPEFFQTPAIDRIISEGANFKHFLAVLPLCAPSRAAILTGLYNHHNGAIGNSATLTSSLKTVATFLKEAGYYNAYIGKYHLAIDPQPDYDFWMASPEGDYVNPIFNVNGFIQTVSGHYSQAVTDSAIKVIRNAPQPFFLVVAHYAPHSPYLPMPEHFNLFEEEAMPIPANFFSFTTDFPSFLYENPFFVVSDAAQLDTIFRKYYQTLMGLEYSTDTILSVLEEQQMLDSTMLVFTSDNGYVMGEHQIFRKRIPYESSIRLPLFIRYPAWFAPGTVIDDMQAANIDLAPTFMHAAGLPDTAQLDGISLKRQIDGLELRDELLMEYFFDNDGAGKQIPSWLAVRTDSFKYVSYRCSEITEEFFDLKNDPLENINQVYNPSFAAEVNNYRTKLNDLMSVNGFTWLVDTVINCGLISGFDSFDQTTEAFIFPNPADDQLTIWLNSQSTVSFEISDIRGQIIKRGTVALQNGRIELQLNTTEFHNGYYAVCLFSESQVWRSRFVIRHAE